MATFHRPLGGERTALPMVPISPSQHVVQSRSSTIKSLCFNIHERQCGGLPGNGWTLLTLRDTATDLWLRFRFSNSACNGSNRPFSVRFRSAHLVPVGCSFFVCVFLPSVSSVEKPSSNLRPEPAFHHCTAAIHTQRDFPTDAKQIIIKR